MFSSEGTKDSVRNIRETQEFVCNLATWDLRDAMNATSAPLPYGENEMKRAGLEPAPSKLVKPPRVAASPVHLECKLQCIVALPGNSYEQVHHVVIGRVVGVHIRDDVITPEGKIDVLKIRPLARLGYFDYTSVESVFSMAPDGPNAEARRLGLEGRPKRPVLAPTARKTG